MVQSRGGLRFPLESGQGFWVLGYLLRKELQGHEAAHACVFSLANNAHPSFSNDAIVRDGVADH